MLTLLFVTSLLVPIQPASCAVTRTEPLLPHIVDHAAGTDPAWVVSGSRFEPRGIKTLWIFKTHGRVRVTAREVTTGSAVRFQRHGIEGAIEDEIAIDNPRQESVLPGGASRELLDTYAFITSYVFYPDPGCYQFDVEIERIIHRITIQMK